MIAILADIHGNYPALATVVEDAKTEGATRFYSLGDVGGYYSMINECIDKIREIEATHLLGNHDSYLLGRGECPRSKSANECIDFQKRVVSGENLRWLGDSEERIEFDGISMVHGGWNDPLDEYIREVTAEYFEPLPGSYFFSGHTHVQALHTDKSFVYCNPGSVGQPRDGNPKAAYALLVNGKVILRRVAYDIDAIAGNMKENKFDRHYYQNLYSGTRIGGGVDTISVSPKRSGED